MPPKKKARVDPDATEANLSWTDDEVELLLGVVRAYSSQKDYEGLEWENVKSKYEDIRKDFVTLYEQQDGLPYDLSLFTRERVTSKIKDIRKKYKKAVDSGKKSGGGRTVATFYDVCNNIWGGCPATTSLEHGVDTADFEVIDITAGMPDVNPRSVSHSIVAHDLTASVSEESSEVGSISRPETPYSTCSDTPDQKDHGHCDVTDSKQVSTNRSKLIEHIKEKRDSKLTKSKSPDQQHLTVMKEELSLKKEMVSEMKQMDKEYQQTMARFASAMENLSQSVSSAFGMMGTLLQRSQPSYWQPQIPQYMAQQQPSKETGYCQAGATICIMLKMMITNMHPCN